eukprot:XP_017952690.1 PREDICTED: transmembrane protease serine 9-like [Xenopus tropicalis]
MVLFLYNSAAGRKPVAISDRIVGGQDAKKGKYPWQALLWCPGVYRCGGTLVSSKWVVSAAHCLSRSNASCLAVILGANKLSGNENEEMAVSVKNIYIHPNYNDTDITNDIGLAELTQAVSFTSYVIPVCLPTASTIFNPGQSCWVTGWGVTEFNTSLSPNTLQEVQMRILSAEQCRSYYDPNITGVYITDQMICARDILGGKDSCQGDSGGPLVCSYGGNFYLVGVVSFGIGCGDTAYPGVYTYVPAYRDWIGKYVPSVSTTSSGSARIGFTYGPTLKGLSLMSFFHSLCWVLLGDLWFVLIISMAAWMSNTKSSFQVFVGDYNLDNKDKGEQPVSVKRIIIHPSYREGYLNDNIALLELATKVQMNKVTLPVCLPDASVTFPDGQKCSVTGWGQIMDGADPPSPRVLREVEVKMMSNDRCNTLFNIPDAYGRTTANLTDTMLCAGYAKGGRDSCNGDVGGPLVCPKDGRWYLAGVVSGGDGCGKPNRPGIYTRVSSYIKWITGVAPEVTGNVLNVKY